MDHQDDRPEILWLSPLPPIRSGIADYAVELLPQIGKQSKLRVAKPPGWSAPADWSDDLDLVPADVPSKENEIVVVHLGNNPHHLWLLDRLQHPKNLVVVLHDAVLHHLLVESTATEGNTHALAHALREAHDEAGGALVAARSAGHQGHIDPFLFPARRPFLKNAQAVLVHSHWAERLIRQEFPTLAVGRVGLAVSDPGPIDRCSVRSQLGLTTDEKVLMHLGFLTPEKGIEQIVAGFAAANDAGVPIRLVVVGEGEGVADLRRAVDRVGLQDRLLVTGWIEADELPSLPAAADLGVVFRTPSAGETSAAALRFLACGVPVAVGGVRQFLEWPEAAAPRLTPGPSAPAELARLLATVGETGWEDRRHAARSAYESAHRPEDVASEMVAFFNGLEFNRNP